MFFRCASWKEQLHLEIVLPYADRRSTLYQSRFTILIFSSGSVRGDILATGARQLLRGA